jgi:uncharacterized protein YdcH (DUF465 family)
MYVDRIKHLQETHRVLNTQIDKMEKNHPHVEEPKLHDMKKQKLKLKDELDRLHSLQEIYNKDNNGN